MEKHHEAAPRNHTTAVPVLSARTPPDRFSAVLLQTTDVPLQARLNPLPAGRGANTVAKRDTVFKDDRDIRRHFSLR